MIPGCSFIQDEAQLGWEISSDFFAANARINMKHAALVSGSSGICIFEGILEVCLLL